MYSLTFLKHCAFQLRNNYDVTLYIHFHLKYRVKINNFIKIKGLVFNLCCRLPHNQSDG